MFLRLFFSLILSTLFGIGTATAQSKKKQIAILLYYSDSLRVEDSSKQETIIDLKNENNTLEKENKKLRKQLNQSRDSIKNFNVAIRNTERRLKRLSWDSIQLLNSQYLLDSFSRQISYLPNVLFDSLVKVNLPNKPFMYVDNLTILFKELNMTLYLETKTCMKEYKEENCVTDIQVFKKYLQQDCKNNALISKNGAFEIISLTTDESQYIYRFGTYLEMKDVYNYKTIGFKYLVFSIITGSSPSEQIILNEMKQSVMVSKKWVNQF
jgi:hypothetical protein